MSSPATPIGGAPTIFSYEAQTDDGQRLTGTIEASDAELAMDRLRAMRLRVIEVSPAESRVRSSKPLRGDDFLAFNQQLAQLTAAGLPVERGLRLIAADVRGGRLARTIEQVAAELERGTPLDEAFEKYRTKFPPLYGRLIRAGVKSGNLSAVLLSLGRHLELVQRLRSVLWRSISYPLFVLVALGFLLSFMGMVVLPQFEQAYAGFKVTLPPLTEALIALSHVAPVLLIVMLVIVIVGPIAWHISQRLGWSQAVVERVVLPMPLIGPVLRANLVARWCDACRVGVVAGLDLPAAIELASDATDSGRLQQDGVALASALSIGKPLSLVKTSLLPPSVPAAMELGCGYHDLPTTLASLSELYERQAELRLSAIPGIITPSLIMLIALVVGFIISALMAPLLKLLSGTGGVKL